MHTLTFPTGLWLPLITPFCDQHLDEPSLRQLVRHFAAAPIDGLILAATTGEALTLDEDEVRRMVDLAAEEITVSARRPALFLGLCGSDTRKLVRAVRHAEALPVDGYLVTCPYYSRPSQDGLLRHFEAIADAASRPVWIYNIPYRTGVNMGNDTLLQLARHPRIGGLKDCCADPMQSFDLLCRRPAGFPVFTGEDAAFFTALCQGADGGILASAHVDPSRFADVAGLVRAGRIEEARRAWIPLAAVTALLFAEPNPAPVKHWLWRQGLIASPELRLPMTAVSPSLAGRLDTAIAGWPAQKKGRRMSHSANPSCHVFHNANVEGNDDAQP